MAETWPEPYQRFHPKMARQAGLKPGLDQRWLQMAHVSVIVEDHEVGRPGAPYR